MRTYVGVEQTQDELEVRLFSGDERHLCGLVAVPWFVGRSLVISAGARGCEVREASSHFAAPWRLCAGSATESGPSRPRKRRPFDELQIEGK